MYVYMCVCVRVCLCMYACMYVCMYASISICMYACIYQHIYPYPSPLTPQQEEGRMQASVLLKWELLGESSSANERTGAQTKLQTSIIRMQRRIRAKNANK